MTEGENNFGTSAESVDLISLCVGRERVKAVLRSS